MNTPTGAKPPPLKPGPIVSINDPREMLEEMRVGAPRASGLVFDWCVTEANFDLEPKIVVAQFGDGYAQRRPAGINTQHHMWNLSMKNTDGETANKVIAFLSARNGVEIFNWTPPRTTTPQNVLCPSWNLAYGDLLQDGTLLYSLSFKFQESEL